MANYVCRIRTNYFRVKDADAFRAFMGTVYGGEGDVEFWEGDEPGTFAFCCCGGISGVRNAACDEDDDDDEAAYDEFISGLQKHVAPGDAIIITEVGFEKLKYLIGTAEVITENEYKRLSLASEAQRLARSVLGNPEWETKDCY